MSVFSEIKLGDAVTFQRGFDITKAEQSPGPIPIVSSSGVSSYHNVFKVKAPGVIIGRKGTLGTVHLVNQDYWPHDTTLWVKDYKGNVPQFVAYFLRTLKLQNFDTGSSNPTLNRNHIHKIKVVFPKDPEIQKKIAAILVAYDDLIEVNKRRIALLENMAEEIYREWFVRMRFPGYQDASFVKGVPEGWDFCPILEISSIRYGKNLPTSKLISGEEFPVYGAAKIIGHHANYTHVNRTIVLGCRGSVGQVKITLPKSFVTNNSFSVEPLAGTGFFWLFQTLKLRGCNDVIGGSAQPQITLDGIRSVKLLMAAQDLRDKYEDICDPIYSQIWALESHLSILTKTRDLLLPRLISGKLSVEDLDIQFPPSMQEEAAVAETQPEASHA